MQRYYNPPFTVKVGFLAFLLMVGFGVKKGFFHTQAHNEIGKTTRLAVQAIETKSAISATEKVSIIATMSIDETNEPSISKAK